MRKTSGLVIAGTFVVVFLVLILIAYFNGSEKVTEKEDETPVTVTDAEAAPTPVEPKEVDPTVPAFTTEDLKALPKENWFANGGNIYNQRYSTLDEINQTNVANLKGKWVTHLGSGLDFKYSGEASPVVYNGVMYVITGAHEVSALDVKTGEIKWTYKPKLAELTTVCCGWTSRGVTIGDGMVFVGQLDAKLIALDQDTGEVIWETVIDDWKKGYTITSAPLYYEGKLYTGISGGEFGIRGRLTAFDAKTGKELWRFYTIPGPGEKGHETWPSDNDSWKRGGAPIWQTPAVDPELGLIYFSTGNAAPDLDGASRAGDNLYAASVVAIDAETGNYKWHFQEVHHDIWDLDAPNPVVLFDVEKDGKMRKALAQAGKTGWVYLLDRTNGEPLVGIDETPVRQDKRQGTAATQPIPEGDSFVPQGVTKEDIQKDAPKYKGKYGDIFTPFWDEPVLTKPSAFGGANWPPSAYNPDTELFYVLGNDTYMTYTRSESEYKEGDIFVGSIFAPVNEAPSRGTVTAMDVRTNKIVWQKQWDTIAYSGLLTTKGGLVFAGHNDGRFIAFDAKTGDQLWEFQTDAGVNAPAVTYEVDGVQYISVLVAGNSLAGSKHGDSLWTFALDGDIGPVGETASDDKKNDDKESGEDVASAEEGLKVYEANCLACHGKEGADGHNGPNLQQSQVAKDAEQVLKKVKSGGATMPEFENLLSEEEIKNVAAYISEVVAKKKE